MSFAPPSTPPRKSKKQIKSPLYLRTPQTSSSKKVRDFFATANGKTPKSTGNLMPVTPDFTPQKSPRTIRKKRSNIEDIFKSDTFDNSFFLPTPSTVGSGRKSAISSVKSNKKSLTMDALAKLNDSLNFESEDEDDDVSFFLNTPSKNSIFTSNLLRSPSTTMEPSSPTKSSIPQTPSRQLIDDEKINNWHGKSKNYFSDDDDLDFNSIPQKLVNPFLQPETVAKNIDFKSSDVDYSTHVEFIHNKTGERKLVKLSDRHANIKPKKLDFTSAM
ncbi:hypothetical protein CLIB1444_02S05314 [[Candida] jaroonii]|uniref:Uncharacterized protein n=1 Tax=[Candida] jaroonii TaxID=467808 RepID=A0ACA9Y2Y0_9ASCO|nr:hypothetical protein CLIB1444_02S05314 [[Candida] jaroonii]